MANSSKHVNDNPRTHDLKALLNIENQIEESTPQNLNNTSSTTSVDLINLTQMLANNFKNQQSGNQYLNETNHVQARPSTADAIQALL